MGDKEIEMINRIEFYISLMELKPKNDNSIYVAGIKDIIENYKRKCE